jgi:hypothetical protein
MLLRLIKKTAQRNTRNATNSRKNKAVVVTRRTQRRNGMASNNYASLPISTATTIRNNTNSSTVIKFPGKEIIGSITLSSSTPVNTLYQFVINPILMAGTRVQRFCSSFQKYRFRRLKFTVASNFPTTTAGSLVGGYTENPDQNFTENATIANQIFACNGKIATLYVPFEIEAKIGDKNKWYNIDDDSDEKMMTTQGTFVLASLSTANITNTVSIPLIMEYEMEVTGQAVQKNENSAILLFPATEIEAGGTDANGNKQLTIAPGETLPFPPATLQRPFLLNPPMLMPVIPTGDQQVVANVIVYNQTGLNYYFRFYESMSDYELGNYIQVFGPTPLAQNPRTTIQNLN